VPRPEARALFTAALAVAGSLVAATPARAEETPEQKLRAVQRQLEQGRTQQDELTRQAETLALDLATLQADGVRAAGAVQTRETVLSTLEAQLQSLTADEAQKRAVVARDHAHEAELLAALARLALNPPEALVLGPLAPEDAVRSGILLGETVPRLQSEAEALSLQLGDLRRLRQEIERKRQAAELQRRGLDKDRQRLDGLIRRKTALRDQALQGVEEGKQRLSQLASEAGDLHELILRLDAARKARDETAKRETERQAQVAAIPRPDGTARPETVTPPPLASLDLGRPKTIRPFDQAKGAMVYPASGTLALRYGEVDEFGASSKGLTMVTRAGAVVVAPFDGRVEFAGPFKGYGQILIIQHGDGYHSLLAGLDRIDEVVGDWLVAGEPVGVMGSGEPKPRLYLELRHNGQPINPLPWLATRDEKVSG
jgi:septal ring factor EnvC (AmiA/AmiB activator)